jgi:hypothetical protein
MHVESTLTSDGDDAAKQRWAPCSPLDDIANSNSTLLLPTIHSTRTGGEGEGGRGLRMSNLSATKMGTQGFFDVTIHNGRNIITLTITKSMVHI